MGCETGFLGRAVDARGELRRYVVYLPSGYSDARAWPAILFLHGRCESGGDGRAQLAEGLAPAIASRPDDWPFVVVFPQKREPAALWPTEEAALAAILHEVEASWRLDPAQRYLTGLSQGGHGALALAPCLPWRFAAIATVCGWAEDPDACATALGATPLWAFHGEEDPVVPVGRSIEIVEAVRRRGGQARLTRYAGVGHAAWERAYGEPELVPWLLGQRREP